MWHNITLKYILQAVITFVSMAIFCDSSNRYHEGMPFKFEHGYNMGWAAAVIAALAAVLAIVCPMHILLGKETRVCTARLARPFVRVNALNVWDSYRVS